MLHPPQAPFPQPSLKLSGGCNPKFIKHCFHHSIDRWLAKAMNAYVSKLITMI